MEEKDYQTLLSYYKILAADLQETILLNNLKIDKLIIENKELKSKIENNGN